jgi:hypothetical protein
METIKAFKAGDALSEIFVPKTKAVIHLSDGTSVTLAEPCHNSMDIKDVIHEWMCNLDGEVESELEDSYWVEVRWGWGNTTHYVVECDFYRDSDDLVMVEMPKTILDIMQRVVEQ